MSKFETWLKTRFGHDVKRDAGKTNQHLKELPSGDKVKLVTSKPAYIYIPYRFVTSGLAIIEDEVKIISQYAIVIGDTYAVANVPAMVVIQPESRKRIKIDEIEYLEFSFDASSVVADDLNLFQNSTMVYYIFNEVIAKGNVPLYFNDVDFLKCLDLTGSFANLVLSDNNVSAEMIVSALVRLAENPTAYYRNHLGKPYEFIALRNIQLGATNTLSKVMGSYYELGITSALSKDSDKLESIEELLRI